MCFAVGEGVHQLSVYDFIASIFLSNYYYCWGKENTPPAPLMLSPNGWGYEMRQVSGVGSWGAIWAVTPCGWGEGAPETAERAARRRTVVFIVLNERLKIGDE